MDRYDNSFEEMEEARRNDAELVAESLKGNHDAFRTATMQSPGESDALREIV
jgi:hypothetical protein